MIKHSQIIEKLSEAQKLRLVTDFAALGDDELNELGVPRVVTSDLDQINEKCEGRYPSFYALANSWNRELIAKIAADLGYSAGEVNLIDTPPARTKSSVYVHGMSEDPYLTRAVAESFCSGLESSGVAGCLADCSLREVDVAAFDNKVDNGVLADILMYPYLNIGKTGGVTAIKCSQSILRRSHGPVADNMQKLVKKCVKPSINIVFSGASQDTLVSTMPVANELVCNTPLSLLRAALGNYRRLKEEVERGTVSVSELNKAFADGVAVSEEMLDAAVDKVIEFAARCSNKRALPHHSEGGDYDGRAADLARKLKSDAEKRFGELSKFRSQTALASALESIVMLKNVGAMPVNGGKLAVLGDMVKNVPGFEANVKRLCEEYRGEFLGYAAGYSEDEEKTPELMRRAVELAKKANTVVMFMGLSKGEKALAENPSLMLPAGQLALFDKVSDLEKNVIVVLVGDFLPDMQFDDYCAGVLFCPSGGLRTGEAVCNVLFGKYNPSGRLAVSGYNDTDDYHKTLRDYKVTGKNKVGQFVGYRHYTSNGNAVKYPFGFGLSFCKFEYSSAKLESGGVSLVVRNTGKMAAREVVQLYVGKQGSALVRPKRELKGFVKVYLKPKEKKRVTIPFNVTDLAVYDPSDGRIKIENGKYTLYIGSSCADIKITLGYNAAGERIAKTGDKLSDYLQSVSNITDGGYTLPAKNGKGKSKVTPQVVPDFPYEKLFLDEFGLEVEQEDEYYEQEVVVRDDDDKLTGYVGEGVKPEVLCDKLVDYFNECAITLSPNAARELIAAMVSSRILFVCTDDGQLFEDYANAIGGFFGGAAAVQSVENITSTEQLLANGSTVAELMETSAINHDTVRVVALNNVVPSQLGAFFTPFIRYASNPENNRITFGSYASGERTITVAQNIWFVMRVDEAGAAQIPAHLADIAALIMPDNQPAGHEPGIPEQTGINYYKLEKAFERVEEKFGLEEDAWKKIDRLTSYVNARTPVSIGNKMWLQMEKMSAAYFALGGDADSALDLVVCKKLVMLFAPMLLGKLTREDGDFAQVLENIFGDEGVPDSKSASGRLGLVAAIQ